MYNDFIAGVDLAGERLPDGKLRSYLTGAIIDDWPDTITMGRFTYTLEFVEKREKHVKNSGYELAEYC